MFKLSFGFSLSTYPNLSNDPNANKPVFFSVKMLVIVLIHKPYVHLLHHILSVVVVFGYLPSHFAVIFVIPCNLVDGLVSGHSIRFWIMALTISKRQNPYATAMAAMLKSTSFIIVCFRKGAAQNRPR